MIKRYMQVFLICSLGESAELLITAGISGKCKVTHPGFHSFIPFPLFWSVRSSRLLCRISGAPFILTMLLNLMSPGFFPPSVFGAKLNLYLLPHGRGGHHQHTWWSFLLSIVPWPSYNLLLITGFSNELITFNVSLHTKKNKVRGAVKVDGVILEVPWLKPHSNWHQIWN